MKDWLRGKRGGLAAFVLIATLVGGGLGWATSAALRLEQEQLDQRAEADYYGRLRLALWRLDGLVSPYLAREDTRPFNHYSAIFAPPFAFRANTMVCNAGEVMEPSPLLSAELPEWMRLHFQADPSSGWTSPQVLSPPLARVLHQRGVAVSLANVTEGRRRLLAEVGKELASAEVVAAVRGHSKPATVRDTTLMVRREPEPAGQPMAQAPNLGQSEFQTRSGRKDQLLNEKAPQRLNKEYVNNSVQENGANWMQGNLNDLSRTEALVYLSPMVPLWVSSPSGEERLLVLRLVRIDDKEICQGIVLDAAALQDLLAREVADLFPEARVVPMRESEPTQPERTMALLPLQLDPGVDGPVAGSPGWTALRVGLALAWTAAGVALLAVALGGWSLIDLSQRRIRFVSAVTHELRTPLTTLRLYLDMLIGGMVRDEGQRGEYLRTLHGEADRLTRLVGNVLDFSRLENQRPRLERRPVAVADLLAQVRATWEGRCQDAGKELLIENALADGATLLTDGALLQQVLGNLIDNACKYSREAEDRRLWVRVRPERQSVVFEVEDRGPGVPPSERRAVFRAFRRGGTADVTAGGVGLGLALARRWTRLLGGRLTLCDGTVGACFRVALPALNTDPARGADESA
jgi:signal transduction histidine kinase